MLLTTAPRRNSRNRPPYAATPGTPQGTRRRMAALFGTLGMLAIVCATLLGTATPAAAHTTLTGSDPAEGAVVGSAPERVTLDFSGGITLSDQQIRVLGPEGDRADTGELLDLCSGERVAYATPLRGKLSDGTYTVVWKGVSSDSHPVSGAFTFSIGAPSETSVQPPAPEPGGAVGPLYDLARYTAYAGFVLLFGSCTFLLTCWPDAARVPAVRRLTTLGWLGLTAATLVQLLLRKPYVEAGTLSDTLDLSSLSTVAETGTGVALLSRLLLLTLLTAALALLFRAPAGRTAAGDTEAPGTEASGRTGTTRPYGRGRPALALGCLALALGTGATWALSEHASTGPQTALAVPVAIVHLLAVAAWLGGLATLLVTLHSAAPLPATAARRFSSTAGGAVLVLLATGLYQSWRQVGSWSALTGTEYGGWLLLKIALIVVLLAFGWRSRRWTARLTERSADDTATQVAAGEPSEAGGAGSGPTATSAASSTTSDSAGTETAATETAVTPTTTSRTATSERAPSSMPTAEQPPSEHSDNGHSNTEHNGTEHSSTKDAEPAPHDPVRAAQLARQRRATETARRHRVRDADPYRAALRRGALTETAIGVLVLAVATLLAGTEPARTAEAARTTDESATAVPDRPLDVRIPFDTGGTDGAGDARVILDPGRTGSNTLKVRTLDPAGEPLPAAEVRISLTQPARGIGPLRDAPEPSGVGRWKTKELRIPVPGEWRLTVTVRTSEIDQVTETRTVRIG